MKKLALIPVFALSACLFGGDEDKEKTWELPERKVGDSWSYISESDEFENFQMTTSITAINLNENGVVVGKDSTDIYMKAGPTIVEGTRVTDSVTVIAKQKGTFQMDNLAALSREMTGSFNYHTPGSSSPIVTEFTETESCDKTNTLEPPIKLGDTWEESEDCTIDKLVGVNESDSSYTKSWNVSAKELDTLTFESIDYEVLVMEKVLEGDSTTREVLYYSPEVQNMILIENYEADTLSNRASLTNFTIAVQ